MPRTSTHRHKAPNMSLENLGIKLPRSGSISFLDFQESFYKINEFLRFVIGMVSHIDYVQRKAHEALLSGDTEEEKKKRLEEWSKRKSPVDELKKHRQFFMEVILVRHVENYLNFLSSMLKEIFLTKPETLRSSEKVEIEIVLKHDSIDDFVKTIAERKVESLSYSSYSDLAEYFLERFGIELITNTHKSIMIEAIETRNISVHNRCIINTRYISKAGADPTLIGRHKSLGINDIEKLSQIISDSVIQTDKKIRGKFKIKAHRIGQNMRPKAVP